MQITCKVCKEFFLVKHHSAEMALDVFRDTHFKPEHPRYHKMFKQMAEFLLKKHKAGGLSLADFIEETKKLQEKCYVIGSEPEKLDRGTKQIQPAYRDMTRARRVDDV